MGASASCVRPFRKHRVAVLNKSPEISPAKDLPAQAQALAAEAKERERVRDKERGRESEKDSPDKLSQKHSPRLSPSQLHSQSQSATATHTQTGTRTHSPREESADSAQAKTRAVSSLDGETERSSRTHTHKQEKNDDDEEEEENTHALTHSHSHTHTHTRAEDEEEEEQEEMAENDLQAELFMQTALSLDMDQDEMLFNMLYFGGNNEDNDNENENVADASFNADTHQPLPAQRTFTALLTTMQQETFALHSEQNTPYKLHPANEQMKAALIEERFSLSQEQHTQAQKETETKTQDEEEVECVCQVCKDDLEEDCEILRLPKCRHYFHKDCLLRWIELQAWCPVCRSSLAPPTVSTMTASHRDDRDISLLDAVSEIPHIHSDDSSPLSPSQPHKRTYSDDYSPPRHAFVRHLDFSAMDNSLLALGNEERETVRKNEIDGDSSFSLALALSSARSSAGVALLESVGKQSSEIDTARERQEAIEEQRSAEKKIVLSRD